MTNKVYILERWWFAYESSELVGVYVSKDLAQAKMAELENEGKYAKFYISEEVIHE